MCKMFLKYHILLSQQKCVKSQKFFSLYSKCHYAIKLCFFPHFKVYCGTDSAQVFALYYIRLYREKAGERPIFYMQPDYCSLVCTIINKTEVALKATSTYVYYALNTQMSTMYSLKSVTQISTMQCSIHRYLCITLMFELLRNFCSFALHSGQKSQFLAQF